MALRSSSYAPSAWEDAYLRQISPVCCVCVGENCSRLGPPGGFIQDQKLGLPHQRPCKRNALALAPRQQPVAHQGLITLGQLDDEIVRIGEPGCLFNLLLQEQSDRHPDRHGAATSGWTRCPCSNKPWNGWVKTAIQTGAVL